MHFSPLFAKAGNCHATKWKTETARDKHLTFLEGDIQLAEIGWKFLKNKEEWNINSNAGI